MRDAAQSSAWNQATWVDPRTAALREVLREIAPGARWSAIGQGALDIMRAAAELSAAELGRRKKDRKPLKKFASARAFRAPMERFPSEWLMALVLDAAGSKTVAPTQTLRLQRAAERVYAQTKTNHTNFERVAFAFVVLRAAFTLRDDLRAETIARIARWGFAGVISAIPAGMFAWLPTDTLPLILFDVCREAPAAILKDERRLSMHTNGNGKVAGRALPYVRGVLAALRMPGFSPGLTRWPAAWRHAHELLEFVVERLDEYSRCHE